MNESCLILLSELCHIHIIPCGTNNFRCDNKCTCIVLYVDIKHKCKTEICGHTTTQLYVYMYVSIHTCIYIHIYIYI